MKLWLLTFIRHMLAVLKMPNNTSISVIAFTTCWAHLKLHQETLDSLFTTFSTLKDSGVYTVLGQTMQRTPFHGLCSASQHGWIKEKRMDFIAARSKFSPITQCWLSLLSSILLRHFQHPTTELRDPDKNLHRLKINSLRKINWLISRPKWFTMYLDTKSRGEYMTRSLIISTEYCTYRSLQLLSLPSVVDVLTKAELLWMLDSIQQWRHYPDAAQLLRPSQRSCP